MRNKRFTVFQKADTDSDMVSVASGVFVDECKIACPNIAFFNFSGFIPLIPCADADFFNRFGFVRAQLNITPKHKSGAVQSVRDGCSACGMTEASCETQFREVSALPITVCFAVVFFCLLQYGFISPGPEVGCISLTLISALAAGIMLQLDVFSKMLKTQQYAADAVADAQRAQLELKKVRAAVSHGEAVQRLEHDMKNLLLLVHMLNERGDSGRIDAVIDRIETEIKAEADGGIQEKEHGACIPIEKFRTCIGSADSCAEDVHSGNGEFAANNEMELPVSRKYAEQALTADNRAKNGGGNL